MKREITIIATGARAGGQMALELVRRWANLGVPLTVYVGEKSIFSAPEHRIENVRYETLRSLFAFYQAKRIKTTGFILSATNAWTDVLAAQRMRRYNPDAVWVGSLEGLPLNPFQRRPGFQPALVNALNITRIGKYVAGLVSVSQMMRDADWIFVANECDRARLAAAIDKRLYALHGGPGVAGRSTSRSSKRYDACFIPEAEGREGWDELVKTWRYVRMYRPGSTLAVAALTKDQAPRHVLRNLRRLGPEAGVSWVPAADEVKLMRVARQSRLFFHPFAHTISPYLAEVLAAGVPVLSFVSPIFEVDYLTGRLTVSPGDCASLGHSLIHTLAHRPVYLRLEREARLAAAGRDWDRAATDAWRALKEVSPAEQAA